MPPGMTLIVTLLGSNYRCRTNFHGPKGVRAIEVRLYIMRKRCGPWLGAAGRGVRSGTAPFAYVPIMTYLTYVHICLSLFIFWVNGVRPDWAPHYVGLIWDCSVCVSPNYDNVYIRPYMYPFYLMSKRCGPWFGATRDGVGFGTAPYAYVSVMTTLTYV